MRNPALETPGLEMIDFIKRSIKEMVGLQGSAQNEISGPGDARAGNDRVYKEKYQGNGRFLRGCPKSEIWPWRHRGWK